MDATWLYPDGREDTSSYPKAKAVIRLANDSIPMRLCVHLRTLIPVDVSFGAINMSIWSCHVYG